MSESDLTVACVYWKGKFRGREKIFSPEWAAKLWGMVDRNIDRPYQFVCFSNVDVPCKRIPLVHDWPGWWPIMEVFRPDLFKGKVLFLGLDVLIMKDLAPIIDYTDTMAMLGAFHKKQGVSRKGEIHRFNTSVTVWNTENFPYYEIYEKFAKNADTYMQKLRGDQDFIGKYWPQIETFPKEWITKLRFCPGPKHDKRPDPKAKVILSMPWKNSVAAEKFKWVKEMWREK